MKNLQFENILEYVGFV